MGKRFRFYAGIIILAFLIVSYFTKINLDRGSNYIVKSSLLGIIIFNNPFILGIYILISLILIIKSK